MHRRNKIIANIRVVLFGRICLRNSQEILGKRFDLAQGAESPKIPAIRGGVLKLTVLATAILFFTGILFAQETTPAAENPLAVLKAEVERVLADAAVPFTSAQDSAVTLMMEDRRQASEELFGDLMNFSAGPTQGEQADQLRSAIEWMRRNSSPGSRTT